MNKTKKRRFTHKDPEATTQIKPLKVDSKMAKPKIENYIQKDLLAVLITMAAFLALLLGFYYLSLKVDLSQYLK